MSLNNVGGHPNGLGPEQQDSVIWAVRRYQSEVAGPVRINFDLRKINASNDRGGGIAGHIFVDGISICSAPIGNFDNVGIQDFIVRNVNIGNLIDFAINPRGTLPRV